MKYSNERATSVAYGLDVAAEHLLFSPRWQDFLFLGRALESFLVANKKMKKEIILDAIETKLIQESRETAAAEQAVQHFVHDQDLARALSLSLSDSAASAVRTVYAVAREGRDNATALAELNAVTDAMRASEATFALEEGSRSLRVEANAAKFFDDTVEFDLAERAYAQAQQSNADRDMALAVAASLSCDLAQNLPWPRRGFSPETVHAVEHGMSALSLTSPELEIEREVTIDETYLSLDPGGEGPPPPPPPPGRRPGSGGGGGGGGGDGG
jgi:hypothetical protein